MPPDPITAITDTISDGEKIEGIGERIPVKTDEIATVISSSTRSRKVHLSEDFFRKS